MILKNTWKKLLTLALAISMLATVFPSQLVFAEEDQSVSDEQSVSEEQFGEETTEESETADNQKTSAQPEDASEGATGVAVQNYSIDYVYIDKPYVETPDAQNIALSVQSDSEIQNAVLNVVNQSTGATENIEAVLIQDGMILFGQEYTDETQSGVYLLQGVSLTSSDNTTDIQFADISIESKYGVNEECETTPDQTIEKETDNAEGAQNVDVSVQTLNEDGTPNGEETIEEGITEALEDDSATATAISTQAENQIETQSSPLVVVLDPGHDNAHTGASGNGYNEQDLTLKIATYCKQELESYYNVKVYMTRSTGACAWPGATTKQCLENRAAFAGSVGANLFVSFHLNSSSSATAHGAEVYYASSSTNTGAQTESMKTAQQIADQLSKLGLSMRGVKTDDFSVLRNSIARNIPAVLIEHCFISNEGDVQGYLSSESGLLRLGQADATGIANYLGLAKGGWIKDSHGWWFQYIDGSYPRSGWAFISGDWYYFNADGYMQTGWLSIKNNTYLLAEDGAMVTGWLNLNGNRYYFKDSGEIAKGWVLRPEGWYYTDKTSGVMQTGWLFQGGSWYFLTDSGLMKSNTWLYWNGTWYYMAGGGQMVTNMWLNDNGTWYYVDANGAMFAKKWAFIKGNWYYFRANGAMATGWVKDGSDWYYCTASGAMKKNSWGYINGLWYYFDTSGRMVYSGWLSDNGARYYFNASGAMVTGWVKDGSDWYYCTASGAIKKNSWGYVNGAWYYFDASGRMAYSRWLSDNGAWYYVGASGAMVTGWQQIDGTWYYFNQGRSPAGLLTHTGLTSIMGASGVTPFQMARMFYSRGGSYPSAALSGGGAGDINTFCQIIYEEAAAEGVKAEVVFGQIMLETGYLRFGGDVSISQFNFAGIGATGNGVKGNSFSSVREGIRAQVQHLKAYASTEGLNNPQVDPRFSYVSRGCAPYVEWLGIKENPSGAGWAAAQNYGITLVDNYINPIYGM